jgi:hypothetical protein
MYYVVQKRTVEVFESIQHIVEHRFKSSDKKSEPSCWFDSNLTQMNLWRVKYKALARYKIQMACMQG